MMGVFYFQKRFFFRIQQINKQAASWVSAWLKRHAVTAAVLLAAVGVGIGFFLPWRWLVLPMIGLLWGGWFGAWALRKRTWICGGMVLLMFLGLGVGHAQRALIPAQDDLMRFVSYFYGERVIVEGRVLSEPRLSERVQKTRFLFEVDRMEVNACVLNLRGIVVVQIFRRWSVQKGDRLRLVGRVHTFYHTTHDRTTRRWDYVTWMRRRGVHFVVSVKKVDPVIVIEPSPRSGWARCLEIIKKRAQTPFLTGRGKTVLDAMMWGRREGLSKEIKDLFRRTGTAHLLAISGFHVGCLCLLVLFLLRGFRVAIKFQFLLTAVVLILYGSVVGWRPSVARAVIMACCVMTALGLGREPLSWNTLAVAAGLILAVNPFQLFEPGFQLSFSCVAVMIGLIPSWHRVLSALGVLGPLKKTAVMTTACLAAWLGALGWTWYHFQTFYPYSVVINVLVCPWAMLIVVLGWALWLSAPIPGLVWVIGTLEHGMIEGLLLFLQVSTLLPGIEITLPPMSILELMMYYGVLGGIIGLMARFLWAAPHGPRTVK